MKLLYDTFQTKKDMADAEEAVQQNVSEETESVQEVC